MNGILRKSIHEYIKGNYNYERHRKARIRGKIQGNYH
jgi:hypothetical protein